MYSKLPAEAGETPTKVVFAGVGDAELARRLYAAHMGPISAFQAKARAARIASGQPGATMHGSIPDGLIRYVYNQGQETLYVTLAAGVVTPQEAPEPPRPIPPPEPFLAIDVLFDTQLYAGGVVWHYVDEVTHHPGDPGGGGQYYPGFYYNNYDTGQFTLAGIDEVVPVKYPMGKDDFAHVKTIEDTVVYKLDENPGKNSATRDFYGSFTPSSAVNAPYVVTVTYIVFDGSSGYGNGELGYVVNTIYYDAGHGTPPYDTVERVYYSDERHFFRMPGAAGLVGNPDPPEGQTSYYGLSSDAADADGRLKPCSALTVVSTISRALPAIDASAPSGFVGSGFLARQQRSRSPGQPPEPTVIDVYVASSNSTKNNNPGTALADSTWDADDSSMVYAMDATLSPSVQVREFVDQTPGAVQVVVTTEMEQFVGAQGSSPPAQYVASAPQRTITWFFAAMASWLDNGNAPALPDQVDGDNRPTMGKLLATMPVTASMTVATVDPVERRVYVEAEWHADVPSMTKLCRIEWTPGDQPHTHGTAKITPA